jgi:hypothetical protein
MLKMALKPLKGKGLYKVINCGARHFLMERLTPNPIPFLKTTQILTT